MADPFTAIAIGGTIAGGVVGAIGAGQSAAAQAQAAKYKAGVAQINKQVALQNASWATQAGGIQAQTKGMQDAQKIGTEKVVQAASGFDVNTGTAAKVRSDMSAVSEYDQNIIRWDAAKTAYGYQVKAASDQAESQLDLMTAASAEKAGTIGEITSFLNAGTSVASKWSQGKQIGLL